MWTCPTNFSPARAQMAAVSEGRHLSDVGGQTGAHASSRRPHSAAICPHVLCEKAIPGLPQEDRLAAGTVPRLPHTVGLLKVQSLTYISIREISWFSAHSALQEMLCGDETECSAIPFYGPHVHHSKAVHQGTQVLPADVFEHFRCRAVSYFGVVFTDEARSPEKS